MFIVASIRSKLILRKKQPSTRIEELTYDWQDSRAKIKMWRDDHPMGPITEEERRYYQELLYLEVGSWMSLCDAKDGVLLHPYFEHELADIDMYRN
ncbi:MAG: hypothetical protein WC648_00395 [Candidatus Paceibacterota bacterium]|jgi:hypothetical protein